MSDTIFLSRAEAEDVMRAIDTARSTLVATIASVQRKKSWSASEKAMSIGEYRKRLETWEHLRQRIGEAHNLGGW